jgi:hypothetical protein
MLRELKTSCAVLLRGLRLDRLWSLLRHLTRAVKTFLTEIRKDIIAQSQYDTVVSSQKSVSPQIPTTFIYTVWRTALFQHCIVKHDYWNIIGQKIFKARKWFSLIVVKVIQVFCSDQTFHTAACLCTSFVLRVLRVFWNPKSPFKNSSKVISCHTQCPSP